MLRKITQIFSLLLIASAYAFAQGLPKEMHLSPDLKMLYTGGNQYTGIFDDTQIKRMDLIFSQPNYWTLLTNNYNSKTDLPATLMYDGLVLDSVGVRFKGQTSYNNTSGSEKKSFNLTLNAFIDGQDIEGYNILNLNNCFDDASFMTEFIYLRSIRNYIPAAKDAYVKLYINGSNWGLYPMVQQLNKDFYKEWFKNNNGTNWRADRPSGGGGVWGDGTTALNYLSADTTPYKTYYTLKSTELANPWQDLVNTCRILNTTPLANLENDLANTMDVDRTLWFLACEIAFSDDDSYVYKGKMDYYVYFDEATRRMVPIEYDGNSAMKASRANWSAFYNAQKVNYPLMNRLFQVPELRQRYLAHLRTIISESFDTSVAYPLISQYASMIDTVVQNDPKRLYGYPNFTAGVQSLKNFIRDRKNNLMMNAEVAAPTPTVSNVNFSSDGQLNRYPDQTDSVLITAEASSVIGIDKMTLFYAAGVYGNFSRIQMYDDGLHGDGASGDGIYGAYIPPHSAGTWMRYYVGATQSDTGKTVTYSPAGAEHNVFVYFVNNLYAASTPVVINEVMASNSTTAADEAGQFDDWIEIYNKSTSPVDLSGYMLSDDSLNTDKWSFPAGTIINPNEYLIVWADEDGSQGPYHANFKLSSAGEYVLLLNPSNEILDRVDFGQQTTDMGYARVPNGTGPFVIQTPTFAADNTMATSVSFVDSHSAQLLIYPNPASSYVNIYSNGKDGVNVEVMDMMGQVIDIFNSGKEHKLITDNLSSGIYFVRYGNITKKLIIKK
ncbi:MAG: T9SS C-terminal target domain-containing protein [Bacteroidetes bacterium]|nr:MAG: T9SS C-terminal target domain-containing protein [Bacteroidota bacterium]